ncbi:MAG: hypothetical protein RSA01_00460 [Clostridium sp.]|uniref:hypothetical protein n=1 Tax=Clostridium sp. TaxID=1506 RepID=UPI002FCB22D5
MSIISNNEDSILSSITADIGTPAERIKEAILEMNIMREERISHESLLKLIKS